MAGEFVNGASRDLPNRGTRWCTGRVASPAPDRNALGRSMGPLDSPFVIAIAFAAFLVAAAVVSGARLPVIASLPLLAALAAGSGALGRFRNVPVVGVLGWLFTEGFVVNQFGHLAWHGAADAIRLGVMVGAAAFGAATGHLFRLLALGELREETTDRQGVRHQIWARIDRRS